ncbi:MAG: hypothetical protein Q9212_006371 [Teloschistes hypoglaucus]
MASRIAILSVLTAAALAQTTTTEVTKTEIPAPSVTPPLQSFLGVTDLDALQANEVSTAYSADLNNYYSEVMTASEWSSFYPIALTGIPSSALASNQANPDLFLASLARATGADRPAWFTALPEPQQDFMTSMGDNVIELYTSEVDKARLVPSSVQASLTSVVSSAESSANSAVSSVQSSASSESSKVAASKSEGGSKSGAPASPVTSGHMGVVAGGVAIAAGLVGLFML